MKYVKSTLAILASIALAACSNTDEPKQPSLAPPAHPAPVDEELHTLWAQHPGGASSRTEIQGSQSPGDVNCHILWNIDDEIGIIYEGKLRARAGLLGWSKYWCISLNTATFKNAYNNRMEISPFTGTFHFDLKDKEGGWLGRYEYSYYPPKESTRNDYPIYMGLFYPKRGTEMDVRYNNGDVFSEGNFQFVIGSEPGMEKIRDNLSIIANATFNIEPVVTINSLAEINTSIGPNDIKVAIGGNKKDAIKPTEGAADPSATNYYCTFYPLTALLRFDITIPAEEHDYFGNVLSVKFESLNGRPLTGKHRFDFMNFKGIRNVLDAQGNLVRYQPSSVEKPGTNAAYDVNLQPVSGKTQTSVTVDISGFESDMTNLQLYACIAPNIAKGDRIKVTVETEGGTYATYATAKLDFGCGGYYKMGLPTLSQSAIGPTAPWQEI